MRLGKLGEEKYETRENNVTTKSNVTRKNNEA
jgi:hypothetical protein